MANRFNAIYFSGKHLDDHGRFHFAWSTIRPADEGITSAEWEFGVRMLKHDQQSEVELKTFLQDNYYEVLTKDAWNEFVASLGDGTDVPNNNFIYPQKKDKWDPEVVIY